MTAGIWLIRIGVAAAAGALVGVERQMHGRPAGLRTHMLVSVASCLVVLAGLSLACSSQLSEVQADVSRVVAGVVTGIGFLGAGAIIKTGDIVRGLTTAACVWYTAVAGVLAALGLLAMTGAAAVLAFLILTVLDRLEDHIPVAVYRDLLITCSDHLLHQIPDEVAEAIRAAGAEIKYTEMELAAAEGTYRMLFHLRMRQGSVDGVTLVRRLAGLEGVRGVSWQRLEDL
ncbi:MAG: MgtC/SapB family protein [Candidatus Fermentibacteraceae bacterium]